ncbi:DUF4845 domain-containing protein [Acidovorax sp. GBBC 3334]|uniref:DUF4845 domain-containing protein n=1 Tax=unclassified Acidovorax TaxID=2684926 RepID=UPI0023038671|nr:MULTISPECIES: DUF4845 domain-containing protein [unclassified Acidovorax]MDA8454587.1 DUF4845 domain-containing protein [Acidovorax sp. GBBC 3334]MDA8519702.1 DUF4845 domain-containing protein [Acidovorax sp. NCPPB 4044]
MGLHQNNQQRPAPSVRRSRQRGLSFIGLVFLAVFAVAVFAIGGQSVPIFLEYQAIRKAVDKAAREASTVADVRAVFDRAASIDNISSIKGSDLEVTKRNEKIVVSFSYSREIALAGPAFLVYRFRDQSN